MTTFIQFFILFSLLLFFHELGHFLVSRLFKVEVEEFGFGFPPRIFGRKIGGVLVSLNAIPFGAFVRPKGENDPSIPGSLAAASPWVRLAVFLGGPIANLLIGFLVLTLLFSRVGKPDTSRIEVMEVAAGSPAETAGMRAGDIIRGVNGAIVGSAEEIQAITSQTRGQRITIELERDGSPFQVTVIPRLDPPEGQGPIGFSMGNPYQPVSWYQAAPVAFTTMVNQATQLVLLPARLINGTIAPDEARVVGVKGIYDIYAAARANDVAAGQSPIHQPALNVLYFLGSISIALGLTNLLPIPAVDGGRILFVLPELLLHKRVPARYENLVHSVGMLMLLTFMTYITIQDFLHPIHLP